MAQEIIAAFAKGCSRQTYLYIYIFISHISNGRLGIFPVAFLFITRTSSNPLVFNGNSAYRFCRQLFCQNQRHIHKVVGELINKSFCVAIFVFFLWLITMFAETPFLKEFSAGKGDL